MNENLATVYEAIADAIPDELVVVKGTRRLTWRELDDRAARLAAHFEAAGLRPGARIVIALYNSIEYVETTLAACKARMVPTNINYRASPIELRHFLERSEAEGIVYHQTLAATVAQAAAEYGKLKSLVCVADDAKAASAPGSADYAAVVADTAPAPRIERSGGDNLIMFTGGTTGLPKAVLWCHRDILALLPRDVPGIENPADFAKAAKAARDAGAARHGFILPPLMHSTGLFNTIGTLLAGGRILLSDSRSLNPDLVWEEVKRERVTTMSIVGDVFAIPLIEALQRLPMAEAQDRVSSIEVIGSVGVRWSAETKAAFLDHGDIILRDTLASTEGGAVATAETKKSAGDQKIVTQFKLMPHAWLMGEDGEPVPMGSGRTGMVVSGGVLPNGYIGEQDGTTGTFRKYGEKRIAVTGDFARAETDGTVTLIGRGSSVINTGGEKVFADEVEKVIASHPAVADVIVAGIPDKRWGHIVGAMVALREGASVTESELTEHVAAQLSGYKKPRHIRFVAQIERKATGKADRQWATDLLASLAAPAA